MRWLADHTPATTELLRLVDGTPVPCGTSRTTARRSDLFGYAGYGRVTSHHRFYWGANLLLVVTCEALPPGSAWPTPNWPVSVTPCWGCWTPRPTVQFRHRTGQRQGLAGHQVEIALADKQLTLLRPARKDEPNSDGFPAWLRQRIEAIIWTLKHQLGWTGMAAGSGRTVGPRPAAPARPQRRHLVQLADWRARQALPDRLRPLITTQTSTQIHINDLGSAASQQLCS